MQNQKRFPLVLAKRRQARRVLVQADTADAECGRMSAPAPVSELDLDDALLCWRLRVEQRVRSDGTPKVLAVDDESGSGIKACAQQHGNITMDSLYHLVAALTMLVMVTGCIPSRWKADIDAAYWRVPLLPEHRWAAWVVVVFKGVPIAPQHFAPMRGGAGPVHAWDRVGSLLRHIGRVLLRMPLFRYVDDFFCLDHAESTEHAMNCFTRIARAVLGTTAVAVGKLCCGNPLEILGVSATLTPRGVDLRVADKKRLLWAGQMRERLALKVMSLGVASRIAGRLSFACTCCFKWLGRAMVRPFFTQQYSPLLGHAMSHLF